MKSKLSFVFLLLGVAFFWPMLADAKPHQKYDPIDTNYPVPPGAVWVAVDGDDNAAGTQDAPLKTVRAAFRQVQSGGTIVVKSGAYREPHLFLTDTKENITIQPEPHGDVWFKGSDIVSADRFEKEGNIWKVSGNFYNFCPVCVTHSNPNFDGVAALPEQVFINDEPLRQVASKAEVVAGTFYVEDPDPTRLVDPNNTYSGFIVGGQDVVTYYLGSDPTQGVVEISQRPRALTSLVKGLKLRGINFAHYSPHQRWDYKDPVYGADAGPIAVSINRGDSLIENAIFTQNTQTALFINGANDVVVRNNRFVENGANGYGNNRGDNNLIEYNFFANNNTSGHETNGSLCGAYCIISHSKITHVLNPIFRFNIIDDSETVSDKRLGGYWCDEGCINAKIVGNFFTNLDTAIGYEVCDSGIIASNIIENSNQGIAIAGSANTRIYNNTISRNHRPIVLREDARYDGCHNANCSSRENWSRERGLSWDNTGIEIYNNILSSRVPRHGTENWWPHIISIGADNLDGKRRIYSNDNFRGLDYNAYYRNDLAKEERLITFDLPGEKESIDLVFKQAKELSVHPRVSRKINGLERRALDLVGTREENPYFIKEAAGDYAFKQSNYRLRDDSPARNSGKALPIDVLRAIDPEMTMLRPGRSVDRGALVNVLFDATGGQTAKISKTTTPLQSLVVRDSQTPSRSSAMPTRQFTAAGSTSAQSSRSGSAAAAQGSSSTGVNARMRSSDDGVALEEARRNSRYSQIRAYSEGLAAVEQDGRWGFIDQSGREIVKPRYEAVQNYRENRAAVRSNGRWGFIDERGRITVRPQYDDVWSYQNGYATVREGDRLKIIDKKGEGAL